MADLKRSEEHQMEITADSDLGATLRGPIATAAGVIGGAPAQRMTNTMTNTITCDACEGSGRVDGERCQICDGEGQLDFAMAKYWFDQAQQFSSRALAEQLRRIDAELDLRDAQYTGERTRRAA